MTVRKVIAFAFAGLLFLGLGVLLAQTWGSFRDRDFFCYWMGPRVAWEGVNPYREDQWRELMGTHSGEGFRGCWRHYAAPMWTAILMMPFAALPLALAATLWMTLTLAATVAGLVLIWRSSGSTPRSAFLFYLIVLSSQPFWELLADGQLEGVLLLATAALAWSLARGRDVIGGLALASLAIKPHLSLLLAATVLTRAIRDGRRRLVAASLAIGFGMLAVSVVFRPSWPFDWVAGVMGQRTEIVISSSTAWGLAADVLGDARWGAALVLIAAAVTWVLLRGAEITHAELAAVAVPLSLFASPETWSYNFVLLALPWGVVLGLASEGYSRAVLLRLSVVACASVAPWLLYVAAVERHLETWSAVIPVATALLVAIALRSRAAPRSRPESATRSAQPRIAPPVSPIGSST